MVFTFLGGRLDDILGAEAAGWPNQGVTWGSHIAAADREAALQASRAAIDRVNRVDDMPAVFYIHPWELDPGQPRAGGAPLKSRLRHYVNLSKTHDRLRRLARDFRWDRIDRAFDLAGGPR